MLIMKFLSFRDRQKAMEVAREMKTVKYQQHKMLFFPDFSMEMRRQQRQFDRVKKRLQLLNIECRFSYPAKLTVIHRGQKRTCNSPEEVEKFIGTPNDLTTRSHCTVG